LTERSLRLRELDGALPEEVPFSDEPDSQPHVGKTPSDIRREDMERGSTASNPGDIIFDVNLVTWTGWRVGQRGT